LPLRNARRSTQRRVSREGGTTSTTVASAHQTSRPPSRVSIPVNSVSDPPVSPKRWSKRSPRRPTAARSSSRLLVAAMRTVVPVGSWRRTKNRPAVIHGSGGTANSDTTGPTTPAGRPSSHVPTSARSQPGRGRSSSSTKTSRSVPASSRARLRPAAMPGVGSCAYRAPAASTVSRAPPSGSLSTTSSSAGGSSSAACAASSGSTAARSSGRRYVRTATVTVGNPILEFSPHHA
jgi:hypothetical protein